MHKNSYGNQNLRNQKTFGFSYSQASHVNTFFNIILYKIYRHIKD